LDYLQKVIFNFPHHFHEFNKRKRKYMIFFYPKQKQDILKRLEKRSDLFNRALIHSIQKIFSNVEKDRDKAVMAFTQEFDNSIINSPKIGEDYVEKAVDSLDPQLAIAIEKALDNIIQVNMALKPPPFWTKEIRPGTVIGEKITPLDTVGLWVPARKGTLISTALMLVGAAKAAGVKNICVGMPPNMDGVADPVTIAAAYMGGARDFFIGNGVSIIAAWSIGTECIPKVNGIFGPGPGGIAAAMSVAFSYGITTVLGIGPTDSAIISDGSTDCRQLAYDLLNEAEHGKDSSCLLVTNSRQTASELKEILSQLIEHAPESKKEILRFSFGPQGLSAIIVARNLDQCCDIINDYAPEHMIIRCNKENQNYILGNIENCGEILLGEYTPFSAANYALGITAVLPTNGFARSISGITCKHMLKTSTIGELSQSALKSLFPVIKEFGSYENLPFHIKAAETKLN